MSARTLVSPNRGNLALIAVAFVAAALLCLWLAFFAGRVGGLSGWIVIPSTLALAMFFGILAGWAIRKRGLDEPALILDDAGLYDNLSLVHAGRVRWSDLNRVWMVGPRWMQFLCVRPENVVPYIEEQEESRGLLMRVSRTLFDAPIVIPVAALNIEGDDLWEAIDDISGRSTATLPQGLATP